MALLPIGEVFGYPVDHTDPKAVGARREKPCPFVGGRCAKVSKKDPLGICSLADGDRVVTLCPNRFREGDKLFKDAGRIAFGKQAKRIAVASEIRLLRIQDQPRKKIGKVDYIVALEGEGGRCVDFAALEVQAVYFSGYSIRDDFNAFLKHGKLPPTAGRRPDFRSSQQKRLMPQLSLKVPIFRRWGKKFFVAVDSVFFANLPKFRRVDSLANSEITWLVYPFSRPSAERAYTVGDPEVVFSGWEDVQEALREGQAPQPDEILEDINASDRLIRLELD